LRNARLDGLVLTVAHADGIPLAAYPGTMSVTEEPDGFHWAADPPRSRPDVTEAIERRDLATGSWRMKVARDSWSGDVRHVHEIAELADVTLTTRPSYPSAAVELRHLPEEPPVSVTTPEVTSTPSEPAGVTPEARSAPDPTQTPPEPSRPSVGALRIEERTASSGGAEIRTLAGLFRSRGWEARDGVKTSISFGEYEERSVSWTGSVDMMNLRREVGVPLAYNELWSWPAFPRVDEGVDVTAFGFPQEVSRTLPPPAHRPIDDTSTKPEVSETIDWLQASMEQVPAKVSGIPNVYLLQPVINTIIERNLTFQVNDHLDFLTVAALDAVAAHLDPTGLDILTAIREAKTVLTDLGWNPDVILLSSTVDQQIDLFKATAADNFYLFAPEPAPNTLWGMRRQVSKAMKGGSNTAILVDSRNFGKLHVSPVQLSRWEENFGQTNTSTVRLECHGQFTAERPTAAVRLATS
jgi:hypothetical protein